MNEEISLPQKPKLAAQSQRERRKPVKEEISSVQKVKSPPQSQTPIDPKKIPDLKKENQKPLHPQKAQPKSSPENQKHSVAVTNEIKSNYVTNQGERKTSEAEVVLRKGKGKGKGPQTPLPKIGSLKETTSPKHNSPEQALEKPTTLKPQKKTKPPKVDSKAPKGPSLEQQAPKNIPDPKGVKASTAQPKKDEQKTKVVVPAETPTNVPKQKVDAKKGKELNSDMDYDQIRFFGLGSSILLIM